jgi:outer membrane protein
VSQARLLRAIGELAPDSFRPAVADKKSGEKHSSSDIDSHALTQYLSWHRCGMTCGGESIAQNANVGISPHQKLTATDHPGHSIQQGARL